MKRFLVTGGSRGLGEAVVRRLLANPDHFVGACARRRTPAVEMLEAEHPDRFRFESVDFSAAEAVAQVVEKFGILEGLDGFVANAAVGLDGLLTLTSEADLRSCVELNLVTSMLLAREVVKGMLRRRGGSLVFVSSVAARTGLSGLTVYSATKAGLCGFSRALAREYGERGIRSNCVLPGFLDTEMSAGLGQNARSSLERRTSLKRLGKPEDVVGSIEFLLSDAAAYVTGTEVVVDGGML